MLKNLEHTNGITIISLVVTIIILIILAGVSLNVTLGENGIITMATKARENMEFALAEEETRLNELYHQIQIEGGSSEGGLPEHFDYDAITKLTEFKKAIAQAITNQQVETSEDAEIDTMVEHIGQIFQARTQDATATSKDISVDKIAYSNGEKLVGTTGDTVIEEIEEESAIPLKEKFYLYHAGNQYSDITGGWTFGHDPGYSSLTFADKYMEFSSHNSNNDCNLNTVKKIDFSGYSRLYYEFEFISGYSSLAFGVMTNASYRLSQANNGYVTMNTSSYLPWETLENGHQLAILNIENITEPQQVVLSTYCTISHIHSVYLR